MKTLKIGVTGSRGQLGQSIQQSLLEKPTAHQWIFYDSKELDITEAEKVQAILTEEKFDFIINCAAYTAVDQAEKKRDMAEKINHLGVKNLAEACQISHTKLIHISTDFVFSGEGNRPIQEDEIPNPTNHYGQTKWEGEKEIQRILESYFILRTGWLYSNFGKNFKQTMLNLSKVRSEISVVYDQVGTPTHAAVLVNVIFTLVEQNSAAYGIYHIANEGVASWYDFAVEIMALAKKDTRIIPIKTEAYPTPAKRPVFSVLDKEKFKTVFKTNFPHWKESLKQDFS